MDARVLAAASNNVPGLPLVGYEGGEGLSSARAAGLEATGALRVWMKPPATAP